MRDVKHVWSEGEELARGRLDDKQVRQVEQTVLRRVSFHAFQRDDIQEKLKLSEKQKSKIDAAIQKHLQNKGGGRPSLWRLGDEIKDVLTDEQRTLFNNLRGVQ